MPATPPPGYLWRPARVEDAAALVALLAAVDEAEDLEEVFGPEGAAHYLTYPGLDPERDTLLALSNDGSALAFAWAWVQEIGDAARAILWIEAHPEHTDLEAHLLAWAEARARERLDGTPPGNRRYLRLHAEEHRRRRRRVIEEAGYHHARTFVEMHRPLTGGLTEPPGPPPGVSIVPWSETLDDAARQACNRAFSTHWDTLPLTPESWSRRVSGDPTFRPDLSRLAVSAGDVVALCLAGVDAESNDREGIADMWVERVGTIPARQRQGLATTLLLHALHAGAVAGMTRAGLTVDEDGTSGATALYERLGFTAERRTLAYVKDVE